MSPRQRAVVIVATVVAFFVGVIIAPALRAAVQTLWPF
ncbi:MAG: hypothetical protein OJF62_000335 [Pseudolabrys sp.]|jgi:hypothetical protein|nr:hypothetical protein [Pseudolabrys sp.]